jgi:predicted HTH transcriptional regulator
VTTEELETLLEGAEETDSLEFKTAMNWDKLALAKDILAMANIQDGGQIVFGIEDETNKRIGMSDDQIATFSSDHMRDQIGEYADPRVVFRKEVVQDTNGLKFIVLTVSPFDEFPVICKRDGPDLQKGTIYYRSKAQKPQSARVSNYTDMRDIIEVAVVRRMQRLQKLGLAAKPDAGYDFEGELGGL